jgi:hypothetical protein
MDKVYIALLSGVLLWYIKSCYEEAVKQKAVAIKLRAYILYWKGFIFDKDLHNLYMLGRQWAQDEIKKAKLNDGEGLIKLEKEIRELIKEKVTEGAKENGVFSKDGSIKGLKAFKNLEKVLHTSPQEFIHKSLELRINRIIEGKTFLTDSEAAELGSFEANWCLRLKMEMIELQENFAFLILMIIADDIDEEEELTSKTIEVVYSGVKICRCLYRLESNVERTCRLSNVELTFYKFFSI